MILINYWTSQYYEMSVGDKYYCKDYNSALNKINEELRLEWLQHIEELDNNIEVKMNNGESRYIYTEDICLI